MNAITTSASCDRMDCGHIGRSESATIKRAAILFACMRDVPGFSLPANEPAEVLAVLALMRAGTPCVAIAGFADLQDWYTTAVEWAEETGESWLVLPDSMPLPALAALLTV